MGYQMEGSTVEGIHRGVICILFNGIKLLSFVLKKKKPS